MSSPESCLSKNSFKVRGLAPQSCSCSVRTCRSSRTSTGAAAIARSPIRGSTETCHWGSSSSRRTSHLEASAIATSRGCPAEVHSSKSGVCPSSFKAEISERNSSSSVLAASSTNDRASHAAFKVSRSLPQLRLIGGNWPQMSPNSSLRLGHGTPFISSKATMSHFANFAHWEINVSPSVASKVRSLLERFTGRSIALVRSPANGYERTWKRPPGALAVATASFMKKAQPSFSELSSPMSSLSWRICSFDSMRRLSLQAGQSIDESSMVSPMPKCSALLPSRVVVRVPIILSLPSGHTWPCAKRGSASLLPFTRTRP
mmetsp:Transcript_14437/g.31643  ORF Transcript_14437/g.31643 Transcript_14437/m.31643 type:complete len:317 (+) Transcript_14437:1460-2410(+)